MNHYNTLKAAWHTDRMEKLRAGLPVVPIEMQFILSDYCNHDCFFCAYRASNGLSSERFVEISENERNHNPNRMISHTKAMEIVEDAAEVGIKSIIFTGGGEPTAHPTHMEVFEKALSLGIDCALNTNGVIFRRGWEDVLPRFTYVRFSVDAATPDEYANVRRCPPSHYKKVLRNIESLRREVDEQESTCIVGTGYVVTSSSYADVLRGVINLKQAGAHYVRLAAMQSTDGKDAYEGTWDRASEAAERCVAISDDKFKVYNLMNGVVGERPDYEFCGFQHLVLYVGANLECYRCCYTAYTSHGLVGSLKNRRLRDYLVMRSIEPFDARSCTVCPLNEKNRIIDYMTKKAPEHVNFV